MHQGKDKDMKIKAVKLYDNGLMTQAFACGGEGMEGIINDQAQ